MATNTTPAIIKSPSDNRTYAALTLDNGLQCLLIRDQQTQMSTAALSMGVGSFKDPRTAQGLAHYLEHMLFMGTEKYPDENDYANYITKHSGKNNAYTSQEETNYHLEISSEAFEGALDRFAQFFISPLMAESSSARELNAVHSQHSKNLQNDAWRKFQLSKHIAKTDSPYNKFSTGDKDSLANENLTKMLKDFYNENYSANLMKLVIYGRQDIETLKKWAIDLFSAVPNKSLTRFKLPECPFGDGALKKMFKIVPVKDKKKLQLCWILPNQRQHYRNHPGRYISHLIGHEGKGSLFSLLMKEGLATSLMAGSYDNYDVYCEFSMTVDLTDKGLNEIDKIIGYTLYYIELLKEKGIQKWIFEELQMITNLKFQFLDKKKGMMQTASIAKHLHTRKIDEIIVEPYLMENFQPESIAQFLRELNLNNLIGYCEAKQFQGVCNLEEPIYKTKYCESALGNLVPIPCDVDLPEKNIFLPKDLSVLPMVPEALPQSIFASEMLECFFKGDHMFELPKININMRINFKGNNSSKEDVAKSLLLEMLKEDLRQFSYLAQTAEIEASISFISYYGMEIKFKGYRDSLMRFVGEYLKKVFAYVPQNQELFQTLRLKDKRKYINYFLDDPYRLVYDNEISSMRHGSSVPPSEKLTHIDKITLKDVIFFSENWNNFIYSEAYIGGNIKKQSAMELAAEINQILSSVSKTLEKDSIPDIRAIKVPSSEINIVEKDLVNKSQCNSAIAVQFQGDYMDVRTELLFKLCEMVAKQPAFDYLRTKEQLGYVVFCLHEDHRCVGGITFIVQSSVKTTYEIREYINIFVYQKLRQILDKLTEKDFKAYQNSLRCTKEEKDKNLSGESTRYWTEVVKHHNLFNRKSLELEIIPTITLADLKIFMEQLFYKNPRRFEFHLTPEKSFEDNKNAKKVSLEREKNKVNIYLSPESFRKKMTLFPDFYAHK